MSARPPRRVWTESDEAAWEAEYTAQKAAEAEAFRLRGNQPPRHSKVNGPPVDWKRWCATLDGIPVRDCVEFDLDEGWVQVYVVQAGATGVGRILNTPQRRLHGKVEAVDCEEWREMKKSKGELRVDVGHLRGDPIPGTELRRKGYQP